MLGRDGGIDFGNLDSATRAVAKGLRRDSLVMYETTLPVGTTRHRVAHLLEQGSGLKAGPDFNLAFSPERLYSGRIFEDLRRYPKIVGGIDEASTKRAVAFYRAVLDAEVWPVDSAETAEFAKLAETTYRDVNIALANELALYGANRGSTWPRPSKQRIRNRFRTYTVRELAWGATASLCIRISYLAMQPLASSALCATAGPPMTQWLGSPSMRWRLRLGVTWPARSGTRRFIQENVKELAFSTAGPIIRELNRGGAHALIHDPLFEPHELASLGAEIADLDSNMRVDAAIVQAFHSQYSDLDWGRFHGLKVVFDGRGALDPEQIRRVGAIYMAVGFPIEAASD